MNRALRFKSIMWLLLSCYVFVSCGEDDDSFVWISNEDMHYLTDGMHFSDFTSERSLDFTTNCYFEIIVLEDAKWCTAEYGYSSIHVSVTTNTTRKARSTVITIRIYEEKGEKDLEIKVSQEATSQFSISGDYFNKGVSFPGEGGEETIYVYGKDLKFSLDSEWCTLSCDTLETDRYFAVTISATKNPNVNERDAILTVAWYPDKTNIIKIKQDGKYYNKESETLEINIEEGTPLKDYLISSGFSTGAISVKTLRISGNLSVLDFDEIIKQGEQHSELLELDLSNAYIIEGLNLNEEHNFINWKNLTILNLPQNTLTIDKVSCKTLQQVSIPSTVTEIGATAFGGCALSEIMIPSSVKRIDNGAFFGCHNLKEVTFEADDELEYIGSQAFQSCSFESIIIPNSVTVIGSRAFSKCANLSHITLPNKLQSLFVSTFEQTNLSEITIPASVSLVNSYAFSGMSLQIIHLQSHIPPTIAPNHWTPPMYYITIYVPMGCEETYRNSTWGVLGATIIGE